MVSVVLRLQFRRHGKGQIKETVMGVEQDYRDTGEEHLRKWYLKRDQRSKYIFHMEGIAESILGKETALTKAYK